MWVALGAVRSAFQFVFGEDLLRWALYLLLGGVVFLALSGVAVTNAILAQPFGVYLFGSSTSPISTGPAAQPRASGQRQLANGQGGEAPADEAADAPAELATVPLPQPMDIVGSRVAIVVGAAMQYLGTPYAWGGCSHRGIDCSCFVQNALAAVGIHAPRVTTQQIAWTTPVSAAAARAGDLVFFDNTCSDCGPNPTHVGLYLGGGRMADCGDPCRIEPVYGGQNARYGRVPGL